MPEVKYDHIFDYQMEISRRDCPADDVKGWLERRADPSDRRINRLHLTREAERLQFGVIAL